MDPPANAATRFVALDVARNSVMVAAVDARQQVVLKPRRVAVDELERWSREHLTGTDAVVLEATANAWHLHDLLRPLVASVTVCHPSVMLACSSTFCRRLTSAARSRVSAVR